MRTIIVPTDFSEASVNAAYYAAEIAMQVKAGITLLHVLPMPILATEVPLPSDSYEIGTQEAGQSLHELKEKMERYSNDKLCITCTTTTRSFQEEMESFDKQQDIFAVVMGTSGAGATEAFFLGSFSLTAATHLKDHPLIMVPPAHRFNGIRKIGLACDMKDVLETVPTQRIKDIFEQLHAELEILYVSKPDEKMYPEVLTESKFIQDRLAGLHPQIRIATSDDVKEGLKDFVNKSGIDLLIIVPKERSFIESIFHQSMTKKMVLHPEVPVMILH